MGLDFVKSKEFLHEGYRPSEEEPFMNENHVEYFREKLLDWKKSIPVSYTHLTLPTTNRV